jgi:ribose/xylose/arabinose/galactoside ABC-type transport system permease subunit
VGNLQDVMLETAVVATAALGMTMIIVSGGIDLSVGSNIAMVTVVIGLALQHNWPPALAGCAGILAGGAVGLLMGLLITQLNLAPFIVSLGLWSAVRGFAEMFASQTTVEPPDWVSNTWIMQLMNSLSTSRQWMIFSPGVWLMLFLTVVVALMLRYTRFGRHIFAIGSNEQTARLCGIKVERAKIMIYVVAALFAGVAGLLQFSFVTVGDPTTANGKELDVIAACVIGGCSLTGGEGSIFGTLIGALIMTVVNVGCNKVDMPEYWQKINTGGIIILAVTLDQIRQGKRTTIGTTLRMLAARYGLSKAPPQV